MTRMLSQLLDAKEPQFRLGIRQLEQASGGSNSDIRLSTDIIQRVNEKIRDLGLDPSDTTAEELYHTLQQRLGDDEGRFRQYLVLNENSSTGAILTSTRELVESLDIPKTCFAIKLSVGKKLLKELPPKKVMKELGYRSVASMIKHEPVPQLLAAALMYESSHWQQLFYEQYKKLHPSNFEQRPVVIYHPSSRKWQVVADEFAERFKNTTSLLPEFGSIIVMPITVSVPNLAITSTLLLLSQINDIRCNSSFIKLQQVQPDFGNILYNQSYNKESDVARLAGQTLSWNTIHNYYSRQNSDELPAVFDPHIQPEDLKLVNAEKELADKIPSLEFWVNTDSLAMVSGDQAVSLNMLDVAINSTNRFDLKDSVVKFVQTRVWNELLQRYLNPHNLEDVLGQLAGGLSEQPKQLVPATEMAEA